MFCLLLLVGLLVLQCINGIQIQTIIQVVVLLSLEKPIQTTLLHRPLQVKYITIALLPYLLEDVQKLSLTLQR